MDRMAIADYLRKNKFKTLIGEVDMPGQLLDKVYTVGQWQGGFFSAVAGVNVSGLQGVKLKTNWG
jgi:hypothetical protein